MFPDIDAVQRYVNQYYTGKGMQAPKGAIVPYVYTLTFNALLHATAVTQQLTMQANSDFFCFGLSHRANVAAAVQTVSTKTAPLVRILVTDTGSSMQWTNSAVDLEDYSSNDAKMRQLPYPRPVQGRSALSITVNNYDVAADYNLDVNFEGVLVYLYD